MVGALTVKAEVFVDSSAALAVTDRRGCGKLRHVRIGHLWVQELALAEEMTFRKVRGDANPADLATKHLPPNKRESLTPLVSQFARSGEAHSRLHLRALQRSAEGQIRHLSAFGCALVRQGPASAEGECITK